MNTKIALFVLVILTSVICQTNIYGTYQVTSSCNSVACPRTSWTTFGTNFNFACPLSSQYGAKIFLSTSNYVILNFTAYNMAWSNAPVSIVLPPTFWQNGYANLALNNNYVLSLIRCDQSYVWYQYDCSVNDRYNTYIVNKYQYNSQYNNYTACVGCQFTLIRSGNQQVLDTVPQPSEVTVQPETVEQVAKVEQVTEALFGGAN